MRIARVEPPKPGGPFERAIDALAGKLPNVRADVEAELRALVGSSAPPIPCPPRIAIIPGVGPLGPVLKVRVKSSDLMRGRSGGLRVLLQNIGGEVWRPIFVYAKTEREDVSRDAILDAIKAST